jgi:predicted membrane-bound mannosyltransferase
VFEIRDRIEKVARSQPSGYATAIDIFTGENWWPLPWYLRRFSQVRWWSAVPRSGRAGPVVLCSPVQEEAVARLLYEGPPPGERELFVNLFPRAVWLRPGVEVRGYVAASLAPP